MKAKTEHVSSVRYRGWSQYEAICTCGWNREPDTSVVAHEAERNHRIAVNAPEVPQ